MMWVLSDVTYFLLALCHVVTYLRLTLLPDVTIHLFDNLLGYPNIAFGLVVNVWCVDTCILALLVSSLSHTIGPVIFRDRGKVAEFAELPT